MTSDLANRVEAARDLKKQLGELNIYDEQEIIFRETSPPRRKVTLWSMETGAPVEVYRYRLESILAKTLPDGRPAFTSYQEKAPVFHENTTKCFMAAGSPEQAVLQQIGIYKVCPAEHLANDHAKVVHAEHKHRAEWKAYTAHVEAAEREADRELRRQEVEAFKAMANAATATFICDECGQSCANAAGLAAHKRSHKGGE